LIGRTGFDQTTISGERAAWRVVDLEDQYRGPQGAVRPLCCLHDGRANAGSILTLVSGAGSWAVVRSAMVVAVGSRTQSPVRRVRSGVVADAEPPAQRPRSQCLCPKAMRVLPVKATATATEGRGTVAPDGHVHGRFVVDASSIETGIAGRDRHLLTSDFLEVETYPTFTYAASSVVPDTDGTFAVTGSLTIHGKTLPLNLAATVTPQVADTVTVTTEAVIDRSQRGIGSTRLGESAQPDRRQRRLPQGIARRQKVARISSIPVPVPIRSGPGVRGVR